MLTLQNDTPTVQVRALPGSVVPTLVRALLRSRGRRVRFEIGDAVGWSPSRRVAWAAMGCAASALAAVGVLSAALGDDVRRWTALGGVAVLLITPWSAGTCSPARILAVNASPQARLIARDARTRAPLVLADFLAQFLLVDGATTVIVALLAGASALREASPVHAVTFLGLLCVYTAAVGCIRWSVATWLFRASLWVHRVDRPTMVLAAKVVGAFGAAFAVTFLLSRLAADVEVSGTRGWEVLSDAAPGFAVGILVAAPLCWSVAAAAMGTLERLLAGIDLAAAARPTTAPRRPVTDLRSKEREMHRRGLAGRMVYAQQMAGLGALAGGAVVGLVSGGALPSGGAVGAVGSMFGVLVAASLASAAIKPVTSVDADGPATVLLLAAPDGPARLASLKARFHGTVVGTTAATVAGLAAIAGHPSAGQTIALAAMTGISVVSATLGSVVGTAVYPRLDWSVPEEIGAHPGAQALEFVCDAITWSVIVPLALVATRLEGHRVSVVVSVAAIAATATVAAQLSAPLAGRVVRLQRRKGRS